MDYFKKVTVGDVDYYVKDEEARSDIQALAEMLITGVITAWLTDEEGNVLTIDSTADTGIIASYKLCRC